MCSNWWKREETEGKWKLFKEEIQVVTEEVGGRRKKEIRSEWLVKERNEAGIKMLQRNTRQTVDEYREKRKRVQAKCRKKKRLFEKNRLEDMRIRNVIRNFYLRAREVKKGFHTRPVFMKEREEELVGDKEEMLEMWLNYFRELFNGEDEIQAHEEVGRNEHQSLSLIHI